jgi:hypothetical protein
VVATTSLFAASRNVPSTTPLIHAADRNEIISEDTARRPTAGGAAVNPLSERAQRIKAGRETPAAPGATPIQVAPPATPTLSPAPPGSWLWDLSHRISESGGRRRSLVSRARFSEYATISFGQDGNLQSPPNSTPPGRYYNSGEERTASIGRKYAGINALGSAVAGDLLREKE